MACATPVFLSPPTVEPGSLVQSTVSPLPSVQSVGSTAARYFVKFEVVPEPSERCTTVIDVDGSVTPGFMAAMAGSFHFLIFSEKIFASVSPSSLSVFTLDRLYDTVMGAATSGKLSTAPPWYELSSLGLGRLSVPAKSTFFVWSEALPCPDPTEL